MHQPIKQMRAALAEKGFIKRPDYVGLGIMLGEAREALGVSEEKAAQDLYIKHSYIRAIERGRLDTMPSMTYAKGYLKMYASYLGINIDSMLEMVDAKPKPVRPPAASVSHARQEPKRLRTAVFVAAAMLALLALLMIWLRSDGTGVRRASLVQPVDVMPGAGLSASPCVTKEDKPAYPPCYADRAAAETGPASVMELARPDAAVGNLP